MTGNRPTWFKPDALEGDMYDKEAVGLHVPNEEDWDYQNAAHLMRGEGGHAKLSTSSEQIGRKGYIKIDETKIEKANQDAFNDSGEEKRIHPSATSSGYNRKKYHGPRQRGKKY